MKMTDEDALKKFEGSDAIAVIGVGCLFPDAAEVNQYWENIQSGRDSIGPIPLTHWRPDDYFDADPKRADHTYAQTGGFIQPYAFDPLQFGLAPHALEATDTTQLLGMVAAHQALIDAGYGPDRSFDRDRVSCLLGVTGTLELVIPLGARLGHPIWKKALAKVGVAEDLAAQVMEEIASSYVPWQENSFPGLLGNVVAGRIANRLDLGGTNSVVDAACASSLAALHMSVMELQAGKADMVITGGMDTFNDIFMYMCFSKTPALSPSGQARPFDAEGDGTILGEGLGAIVLKRLDRALADGDRVYAVIRGIGSASDGKGQAIYAPSAKGQVKALERAYQSAGVSPRSIGLLEAHGTGTKVGDGVELDALTQVYRKVEADAAWCSLGSVKSQIGHTKAAAGAAGLIKAVMALHHKVLPPTLKILRPHPRLLASPFLVSPVARPWVSGDAPRRAAVSAFGFGGSNYHCVVEELQAKKQHVSWDPFSMVALFSATDASSLIAQLDRAAAELDAGHEPRLLARRWRQEFQAKSPWRLGIFAEGWEAFREKIEGARKALSAGVDVKIPGVLLEQQEPTVGRLALIFAGQGSQTPGMLRDLACRFPEFLESLEESEAFLLREEGRSLHQLMYPGQAFDTAQQKEQSRALTETRYAQLALAAAGRGVWQILQRFGVKPDALAGHSFGELLALYAAGVWSEGDLLRAAYHRGRLMSEKARPGAGLLAVMAAAERIAAALADSGLAVSPANYNAPEQVVYGGAIEALDAAQKLLKKHGIASRMLDVSTAFHTAWVGEAVEPFAAELEQIPFLAPRMAVYANRSAAAYGSDPRTMREDLVQQIASPVRFAEMMQKMLADGVSTFVEVGPGSKLKGLLRANAGAEVLSLDSESTSMQGLAHLLLQLSLRGFEVDWSAWDPGTTQSTARQGKFHVMLSGANHRSPAPEGKKPDGKKQPDAQDKQQKPIKAESVPNSMPIAAPMPALSQASQAQAQTTREPKRPITSERAPPSPILKPKQTTQASNREVSMSQSKFEDLQRLEKLLGDMQDMQRRTADAHTLFLENQRQFQTLLRAVLLDEKSPLAMETRESREPETEFPLPREEVSPRPSPLKESPVPSTRPFVPLAPTLEKPRGETPRERTPAPVKTGAVSAQSVALPVVTSEGSSPAQGQTQAIIIDLISQSTGYPAAMLEPSMDLESDLGIDSIKKVEIYSQLQQALPQLNLDPQRQAEARTIADLIRLAAEVAVPSPAITAAAAGERRGAWAAGQVALVHDAGAKLQQVVELIAEKTGFPVAMLEGDLDLEADLGIDSIKKVEIFSSLQEKFPELLGLAPETLNQMRTISDLQGLLAPSAPVEADDFAPLPIPLASSHSPLAAPLPFPSRREQEELIYRIIAEKTGYPREVIAPEMDLEADLGIDSIKRVEILSALAEQIPSMQNLSPEVLSQAKTILDFISVSAGTGDESVAEALLDPQLNQSWDLSGKKKEPPHLELEAKESGEEREASEAQDLQAAGDDPFDAFPDPLEPSLALETAESSSEPSEDVKEADVLLPPLPLQASRIDCLRLEATSFQSSGRPAARTLSAGQEIWIADDGSNLARNMMLKMQERGVQARLVSLAMQDRWSVPEHLSGLFILAPLKFDVPPLKWLQQAFALVRKVGPTLLKNASQALLVTITRHGGRFGLEGLQQLSQSYAGGIAALAKTVDKEWPEVHARALDIGKDFADGFEAALRVIEVACARGPVEIGVTRDQLFQLELRPENLQVPSPEPLPPLRTGDLILVTGGARGVTAAALKTLASAQQPHFVIWGRSVYEASEKTFLVGVTDPAQIKRLLLAADPELKHPRELEKAFQAVLAGRELRETIQDLTLRGAKVNYRSVDVSKEVELRTAFDELKAHFGIPVGVIHGAGLLRDRLLLEQKDEDFALVLETKLRILPHLEDLVKQGCSWIVHFSSSTARLGRRGQVAYGIANETLNKSAHYFNQIGARSLAMNWGPWDGGMVQSGLKKLFAAEGVQTIPLEAGAQLLHDLLGRPDFGSGEWVVLAETPLEAQTRRDEGKMPNDQKGQRVLKQIAISIEETPILIDHVLQYRAVIPAALLLEWMCAAAHSLDPTMQLAAVDDFQLWKGITLGGGDTVQLEIVLLHDETIGTERQIEIAARGAGSASRSHARARMTLTQSLLSSAEAPQALPTWMPAEQDALQPYEDILFQGESLHLIEQVLNCDAAGLWAILALQGKPEDWAQSGLDTEWNVAAPLLDAIFQSAIVWSSEQLGQRCLPSRLRHLHVHAKVAHDARVWLQLSCYERHGQVLHMRAFVYDETGTLLWSVPTFEMVADAGLKVPFGQNRLPPLAAQDVTL